MLILNRSAFLVSFKLLLRPLLRPAEAEKSCKVLNGWEKGEVKPTKEERRATAAKEKDVASLRKIEKGMKSVSLGAGESGENMSKRKIKKIANKKLEADKEAKKARRLKAHVDEGVSASKGISLGGEATKENNPKAVGKSGDSTFGTGFNNNLRGAFK